MSPKTTPTKAKGPTSKKAAARKPAPKKAVSRKTVAKKPAAASPKVQPAPKVGAKAPVFSLAADDGTTVSLADLKGKNVVLYFYPRDMTPGCTIEACGFRDAHKELAKRNAVVLGVSRDSVATHQKFRAKEKLPFRLLSDPDASVIGAYGSFGEKSFMGRKAMGILRTTVLIDGSGKIRHVYPKVSVKTHAKDVLAALDEMSE